MAILNPDNAVRAAISELVLKLVVINIKNINCGQPPDCIHKSLVRNGVRDVVQIVRQLLVVKAIWDDVLPDHLDL